MQQVIITRGLPASGKSTWSKHYTEKHPNFKRINRDDLRFMIGFGKWTNKREEAVLVAREALTLFFILHDYDIIIDDTNLVPERMEETLILLKKVKAVSQKDFKVRIKNFKTDVNICVERDSKRPDETKVGEKFIRDYNLKYSKYLK
jgi:predicted kinase